MGWWRHLRRYSPHQRWTATKFQDTTLFLSLAMWLCILPLLAIFALPFLGWKVIIYLAGFLLVAALLMATSSLSVTLNTLRMRGFVPAIRRRGRTKVSSASAVALPANG